MAHLDVLELTNDLVFRPQLLSLFLHASFHITGYNTQMFYICGDCIPDPYAGQLLTVAFLC